LLVVIYNYSMSRYSWTTEDLQLDYDRAADPRSSMHCHCW